MNGDTQGDWTAEKLLFNQKLAEALIVEVDGRLRDHRLLVEVISEQFVEVTAAPVTAALEIASTVNSNIETAINNYLMLIPNSWRTQQERILYSPSEYLGHVIGLAFEMVAAGKASYRDVTLDVFSAAEEHVRALTLAAVRNAEERAVRNAEERQDPSLALHSLFDSFSPDQYLSNISRLAHQMWEDAGDRSALTAISIWLAAERHIRVIGSAAIGAATSRVEAGKALAAALERFVPEPHLSAIRVAAYYLSSSADSSPSALDNWLRAEREILERIRARSAV